MFVDDVDPEAVKKGFLTALNKTFSFHTTDQTLGSPASCGGYDCRSDSVILRKKAIPTNNGPHNQRNSARMPLEHLSQEPMAVLLVRSCDSMGR